MDSLFTNIPLEETIDICVTSLFQDVDTFEGFNKNKFRQLLHLATKELHLLFSEASNKQVDEGGYGITTWTYFGQCFFIIY